MEHIIKYIHGVEPIKSEALALNSYWFDTRTNRICKIVRLEGNAGSKVGCLVKIRYCGSNIEEAMIEMELRSFLIEVSKPETENWHHFISRFWTRRTLTLEQLGKKKPAVMYVMNGMHPQMMRKSSITKKPFPIPELIVSLPSKEGKSEAIKIHGSFLPVDLSERWGPNLIQNEGFRRAVARGHLYVLTPKHAKAILRSEAGQKEKQRLLEIEQYVSYFSKTWTIDNPRPPEPANPFYKDLNLKDLSEQAPFKLAPETEINYGYGE
jgi:hypothetical protein